MIFTSNYFMIFTSNYFMMFTSNYFIIFTSNYFCTPERLADPFRGPSSLIFSGKQNCSGQDEKLTTDHLNFEVENERSYTFMVCRGISVQYFHLYIQES